MNEENVSLQKSEMFAMQIVKIIWLKWTCKVSIDNTDSSYLNPLKRKKKKKKSLIF